MSVTSKSLRWQRSLYSPLWRQLEIFGVIVQFSGFLLWDQVSGKKTTIQRSRRARWLVRKLLELGPTFIKIGQSLSTRIDLLPLEYIEQLSQLQDRVPEFDGKEAIAVIENELGKPLSSLFRQFEIVPLASASLGQVHRAILQTGETVVVKVQRQGLEKLFNLDFEVIHRFIRYFFLLHFLIRSLSFLLPFLPPIPTFKKEEIEGIYRDFFELLYLEIDYIHEGKNADRFRENFRQDPRIKVPKVYWQYTTRQVLTLEYLPGIKVNDRVALEAKGINLDKVISLGICSYLKQLLLDGFFQSDPHPGNMAVTPTGELIFYDFGTMAEVKTVAKDQMIQTFFAVLRNDADQVVQTLIYMGLIEVANDMTPVKKIVSFLLENFRDKPVDINALEAISDEVYLMFKQQPFRLPPQMTFVVKSISTLDGIARALDPQYNLLAASQPFIKRLAVSQQNGSVVKTVARQTIVFLKSQVQKSQQTEKYLKSLVDKVDRGEGILQAHVLDNKRLLTQIYLGIKTLIYTGVTGFSLLGAILLVSSPLAQFAIIGFGLCGLSSLWLLRSLIALMLLERN